MAMRVKRSACAPIAPGRNDAMPLGGGRLAAGMQALLMRLADTDLPTQLAYQDRIRAFDARLQNFYHAYLFLDRRFGKAISARALRFGPS